MIIIQKSRGDLVSWDVINQCPRTKPKWKHYFFSENSLWKCCHLSVRLVLIIELDRTYDRRRKTSPSTSVRELLDWVNGGKMSHPKCRWHHFMGWVPRLHKEKARGATVLVCLLPLRGCFMTSVSSSYDMHVLPVTTNSILTLRDKTKQSKTFSSLSCSSLFFFCMKQQSQATNNPAVCMLWKSAPLDSAIAIGFWVRVRSCGEGQRKRFKARILSH